MSIILIAILATCLVNGPLSADDQLRDIVPTAISNLGSQKLASDGSLNFGWNRIPDNLVTSAVVLPRNPRVTRSRQPLYWIELVGGDQFLAECLDWSNDTVRFRLLSGQLIRVPTEAVSRFQKPVGEFHVLDESFESDNATEARSKPDSRIDDTQALDSRRSLKLNAESSEYRLTLPNSVATARLEFWFQIDAPNLSQPCGDWQLRSNVEQESFAHPTITVGPHRRISATHTPKRTDFEFQALDLSAGWHSFVGIIDPDRTLLILDDLLLASYRSPKSSIGEILFRPPAADSKNVIRVDSLHVDRIEHDNATIKERDCSVAFDRLAFDDGSELFGTLRGMNRTSIDFETFAKVRTIRWNRIAGFNQRDCAKPIQPITGYVSGLVSTIEMQPFVDRPHCPTERWTATIIASDAHRLTAHHWLAGELTFDWANVRRINPQFFGPAIMIEARQFHLGNSIRSDFRRHRPDGTELHCDFRLTEIPIGQPHLSFEIDELEAAGRSAPPGSPYLKQLRAGRLITEVVLNDRRIGDLNSLIRFKARAQNPDRIRFAVSRDSFRVGENTLKLIQKPLDELGREFDDCEIGRIRLEFDIVN